MRCENNIVGITVDNYRHVGKYKYKKKATVALLLDYFFCCYHQYVGL